MLTNAAAPGLAVEVGVTVIVPVFVDDDVAVPKMPPPRWSHDPVLSVTAIKIAPGRTRTKFLKIVPAEAWVTASFVIVMRLLRL
ncbi:MAG: hypothetical protein ACRELF_26585 [Gemmataceae bacterium]